MPSSNIIHVGVVGLGHRGVLAWIPLLQKFPQCRVVALCDQRASLLENALSQHADLGAKGYTDFDKMLTHPGLDAVAICTDATTQVELATQALEHGLHATTEVPLCYTIEDCWKYVLATERSGKVFQLAEQVRYWGFIQEWRKLVAAGELGKILYAEGEYVHYYPGFYFRDKVTGEHLMPAQAKNNPNAIKTWRHEAHPIGYLPHTLSPLLHVIEDRVVEVSAMGTRPRSYFLDNVDLSDIEVALMKTANDSILRVMAGFSAPAPTRGETSHHWYQVRGTRGAVEWKRADDDTPRMWQAAPHIEEWDNPLVDPPRGQWASREWSTHALDASGEARASGHGGADYYPIASWLDAIQNNTAPPLDVYLSAETAAPAAAAIESLARGGRPVRVPDFRPNGEREKGEEPKTRGFED